MIERELEVMDDATEEASDIAVALADLRDALDGKSSDEVKESLAGIIGRINGVADVLTALSIDLFKVNINLTNNANAQSSTGEDLESTHTGASEAR